MGRATSGEVIFGFFIILSIYFFLKERKHLSYLAFLLALFSKETAVMLPFALVILSTHKNLSHYVLKRDGIKKGIIENYNRAIALNPNYANAYNNRGLAYSIKGNINKATSDFQKTCDMGSAIGCENLQEVLQKR